MTRDKTLFGFTESFNTHCGPIKVTVNYKDNRPYEIFVNGEVACTGLLQVTGRLLSIALRNKIPLGEIEKQMRSIRCYYNQNIKLKTCGFHIAEIIKELKERPHNKQGLTQKEVPKHGEDL